MVSMRSRRPSVDASVPATAAAVGGLKTIGLVGGVALLINNITGSAMVLFPSLYQAAGWLIVSIALLAVCFLSYLCSIMIIEAMAFMPGNHRFDKRVEYTTLAFHYLGRTGYGITQLFFQFSLAFNNISSIIQSVQVMDFAIAAIAGKSCAVPEFYPNFGFHCPDPVSGDITVFGSIYVLSIGFIVTALVCAPLGFWNLDDNIIIQKVSCSLVCLMVMVWVGVFLAGGIDASRVPAVGTQFTNVLGTTVFNFAVITSIPSWVNEKKPAVSILATMAFAMPMALTLFSVIGIFGGMAFVPWFNTADSDQTLLTKLQNSSNVFAHITFYLFPVVVNLTSIPVFAIMQRYNLLEANVCGPKMANFLGVVLPWLVCVPFYTGQGFSNVVNWGGVVFNSTVNFIIPPLIYIAMVRKQRAVEFRHLAFETEHSIRLTRMEDVDDTSILTDTTEAEQKQIKGLMMHVTVDHELDSSDLDDGGSYVPPSVLGGVNAAPVAAIIKATSPNEDGLPPTTTTILVQKHVPRTHTATYGKAGDGGGAGGALSSLGPASASHVNSSLKQSLLGGGGGYGGDTAYASTSGAYVPSEIDVRSEADEKEETRILGYNPFEAEREEERLREEAVLAAAAQIHAQERSSMRLAVPLDSSKPTFPPRMIMPSAPTVDSPGGSGSSTPAHGDIGMSVDGAGSSAQRYAILAEAPWRAMPLWVRPHRILMAKTVAILLVICAVGVVGLMIQQCATGQGC